MSEGDYYANPHYRADARAASRAGLAVLAYAFADPDRTAGAATASFAVRAAGDRRGSRTLPLVVDLENDPYAATDCYWFSPRAMVAWIAGFVTRARALTGSWPVIYTTDAWWSECTGATARFRHDPLWLADYDGGAGPSAPTPWRQWSFWQYSQDGYLPGIGPTDLDYFQPAPGFPSLRPPAKPKARHPHKRHSERKPKRKRTNRKRHSKTIRKHNQ